MKYKYLKLIEFTRLQCNRVLEIIYHIYKPLEHDFCPRYFDGWACINGTKSGETAMFECPSSKHQPYLTERKLVLYRHTLLY